MKRSNMKYMFILKTALIFLISTLLLNQSVLLAQTPGTGIFFQAIARDQFANPAKDRKIYVQSSIVQTSATGTKVLIETHQTTTDGSGVFSISVGQGTRTGGTVANLDKVEWAKGPYYLNLKIAITPMAPIPNWDYTKDWIDLGTSPFGTVPYALYSGSSGALDEKLSIADTAKMLAIYAKAQLVNNLSTQVNSKISATDTATMLAPYAKMVSALVASNITSLTAATVNAALDSKVNIADSGLAYVTPLSIKKGDSITKASLGLKLNIADSGKAYVTPLQLKGVTFDTTSLISKINKKINLADSTIVFVTPLQLAAKTFDSTTIYTQLGTKLNKADTASLSSRINLKSNTADLTSGLALKFNKADTNLLLQKADTASLSSRINLKSNTADLTSGLALKFNKADTNLLLQKADTSTLSNRINLKANTTDLTSGLALKFNKADTSLLLQKADTSTLSNRINLKANTTDVNIGLALKLDASQRGLASGVASLDANSKVPASQIPVVSFQSANVVASQAAMLGLSSAVVGSIAIRTDINRNFVLSGSNPTVIANWVELAVPTSVTTINNIPGAFVTLTTDEIGEGTTNKYYTDARARAAISASGPLNYNASTGTLSITAASGSSNGYLSASDFTTFNNKQNTLIAGTDYATPSGNITGNAANVTGVVSIVNGGTGTSTATGALTTLGAEARSNKSIATDLGNTNPSDTLYPSQKAVKRYVDAQTAAAGVLDGTITNAKLAGSITNNKLTNSSLTIGTTNISLGATTTSLAGLSTVTATNFTGALTGNVTGNVTGNITGDLTGNVTGNASTATKLAATKNINGVPFDGSANITIAADANTLTGTTLSSNVLSSSLTSVGTITTGVWSGTEIAIAKGGTGATTAAGARTNLGLGALATKSIIADADVDASAAISFSKLNITKANITGLGVQEGLTAGSGISINAGAISATGLTTSNLASNAAITNAQLANSTTTLGSTTMTLGGTITSVTGLTSLSATNLSGTLSGTATKATNIEGGVAGSIPYQTAAGTTDMIPQGAANQLLTSTGSGTYTWTSTASVTGNYVPYTGATAAVNLGSYDLTVNGLTVGKGGSGKVSNTVVGINALSANITATIATAGGSGSFAASFLRGSRTASQLSIAVGGIVSFSTVDNTSGSDISLNTSDGKITLRPGNTYRLIAAVPNFSGNRPAFMWYNETSSSYIGSASNAFSPTDGASNVGAFGGIAEVIITPSVSTVLSFRLLSSLNSGSITVGGLADFSATGSYPWFEAQLISGNTPVTGQSVDYVSVVRTTIQTVNTGDNLLFNTINGGNIPYNSSTGNFNLTAGKTYRLTGSVSLDGSTASSSGIDIAWKTAAGDVLGNRGLTISTSFASTAAGNGLTDIVYTPTINTTVSLNVIAASASAKTVANYTYANIQQIGSSAFVNPWTLSGTNTYNTTGNVGIGTSSPDATAIMDVASTSKGILIPRMTASQKNAISSPTTGLLIFQTDAPSDFYYYNGSTWASLRQPNWTSAGTIQSVGWNATTTAPTIGTTAVNDYSYKQIGSKTWSCQLTFSAGSSSTGANNGSGDYLFTLPNGLQFNTSIAGQASVTDNVGTSNWTWPGLWLSSSNGSITNLSQGGLLYVVQYSSTQFRLIHVGIAGIGAVMPYASGYYGVGSNISWRVTFTFQSL